MAVTTIPQQPHKVVYEYWPAQERRAWDKFFRVIHFRLQHCGKQNITIQSWHTNTWNSQLNHPDADKKGVQYQCWGPHGPQLTLVGDQSGTPTGDIVINSVVGCHYFCQAHGNLPCHKTSPPFGQYQIILLGETGMYVNLLRVVTRQWNCWESNQMISRLLSLWVKADKK